MKGRVLATRGAGFVGSHTVVLPPGADFRKGEVKKSSGLRAGDMRGQNVARQAGFIAPFVAHRTRF